MYFRFHHFSAGEKNLLQFSLGDTLLDTRERERVQVDYSLIEVLELLLSIKARRSHTYTHTRTSSLCGASLSLHYNSTAKGGKKKSRYGKRALYISLYFQISHHSNFVKNSYLLILFYTNLCLRETVPHFCVHIQNRYFYYYYYYYFSPMSCAGISSARTGRRQRSLMSFPVSVLLIVLLAAPCLYGEAALTNKVSYTVAGIPGVFGSVDGFPGKSELMNPSAICTAVPDTSTATTKGTLLIGTKNAFRTFRRQDYELGFWFGRSPGSGIPTTGPIDSVSLLNPFGCVSVSGTGATYYVQGNGFIYTVVDQSTVYAFTPKCPSEGCSFVDVTFFDNYVYAIDQRQKVFKCSVTSSTNAIASCTEIQLDSVDLSNSDGKVGIAVSSKGIFVASGASLDWYDTTGRIHLSSSIPAVDVHRMLTVPDTLIAVTAVGVYSVSTASNSALSPTLLAGTASTASTIIEPCSTSTDYDGTAPTFCSIYKVFPISFAEMYLTNQQLGVLRLLSYPTVTVPVSFNIPFPIGMTGAEQDLEDIYDKMDETVRAALKEKYPDMDTNYVQVNRTDASVSTEGWVTTINVQVPQNVYDSAMDTVIRGANYNSVINAVNAYYNGSDEMVYTDRILVDMCNATSQFVVAHSAANATAYALTYPLIYSTRPELSNADDAAVDTLFMKLLMPKVFGDVAAHDTSNTTTAPLLEAVDYAAALLLSLQESYAADRQGYIRFPEDPYHISQYGAEEQQKIRLYIQNAVTIRSKECSGQATVDMDPTGTCPYQVSVSNRTMVTGDVGGQLAAQYWIFIPSVFSNFDVQTCLDNTDWSSFLKWLRNTSKSSSKCGTGCIIAIAVVAAVVVVILLIILIVCISKRRRLAVVNSNLNKKKSNFETNNPRLLRRAGRQKERGTKQQRGDGGAPFSCPSHSFVGDLLLTIDFILASPRLAVRSGSGSQRKEKGLDRHSLRLRMEETNPKTKNKKLKIKNYLFTVRATLIFAFFCISVLIQLILKE
eukprot:gene9486-6656_t